MFRALSVALGDVDTLDAGLLGQTRPFVACLRLLEFQAGVGGNIQQRALDEPRHHARVGATAGYGCGTTRALAACGKNRLAQRVIRSRLRTKLLVEVEALPGLDHGVDVERADLAAELHNVERGGVDRHVHAKALAAARGQQRGQQVAIVVLGDRLMDEADAALIEQLAIFVFGIDDDKSFFVITEMTFDQRQGAFADRTEADQYDWPVNTGMHWPFRHRQRLQGRQVISLVKRKRNRRRAILPGVHGILTEIMRRRQRDPSVASACWVRAADHGRP